MLNVYWERSNYCDISTTKMYVFVSIEASRFSNKNLSPLFFFRFMILQDYLLPFSTNSNSFHCLFLFSTVFIWTTDHLHQRYITTTNVANFWRCLYYFWFNGNRFASYYLFATRVIGRSHSIFCLSNITCLVIFAFSQCIASRFETFQFVTEFKLWFKSLWFWFSTWIRW